MVTVDYIMYSGHDIIQLVECYPLWQVEVCMQNYVTVCTLPVTLNIQKSPLTGLGGHTLIVRGQKTSGHMYSLYTYLLIWTYLNHSL